MEYSLETAFLTRVWLLTVLGKIQAMSLYRNLLAKQDNTRFSPSIGIFSKLMWNPLGTSVRNQKTVITERKFQKHSFCRYYLILPIPIPLQ